MFGGIRFGVMLWGTGFRVSAGMEFSVVRDCYHCGLFGVNRMHGWAVFWGVYVVWFVGFVGCRGDSGG